MGLIRLAMSARPPVAADRQERSGGAFEASSRIAAAKSYQVVTPPADMW